MRESKPMAREVLARLVKWLENNVTTLATGWLRAERWWDILGNPYRLNSFFQALAHTVKMLPVPWAYERRKGKHGWEYRFWREEPQVIVPDGPEIQEEPVKMTPEEFCLGYCEEKGPIEIASCWPGHGPKCGPFRAYFGPLIGETLSVHNGELVIEKPDGNLVGVAASTPEHHPTCPADFIHKGAVRKRLIDMLLDPGAALDITLLNYVRELED